MSYQSIGFLLFSGIVLILYYALGRRRQRWVLAAANLTFYMIAGLRYLPFLAAVLLATYAMGRKMQSVYDQSENALKACSGAAERKEVRAAAKTAAGRALRTGMFVTIALLAVCKYTAFVLENVSGLLSLFRLPPVPAVRMILPLGISFYSFMALSYVLDVYWKRYPAETDFLNYALYLTYFPHLVQGPIDRFNEFRDQIRDGVAFDSKTVAFGAELVIWGFFKKLVIADRLNLFVSYVFDNWKSLGGLILFLGVVVYSVQIYADFSGCIDIVTGVSEMFGIRLRKNFNHPYFSRSMAEFWRRWHISLQEWFKDYVYYPVFTSDFSRRVKKQLTAKGHTRLAELFTTCFPILVVWLITGLWHGASWNFVLWGIFHAILLIGAQVLEPAFRKADGLLHIRTEKRLWHAFQTVRTFLLCCLGRIFFRTATVADAFGYLGRMITHAFDRVVFEPELKEKAQTALRYLGRFSLRRLYATLRSMMRLDIGYGISMANVIMAVIVVAVLWYIDVQQEKKPLRETLSRKNIAVRWLIIYAGIFAVIIFGVYGPGFDASSFIYEKF